MTAPVTLQSIRDSVGSGSRSATAVCTEALERLDHLEPSLHAFNTVMRAEALAQAAEIDRHLDRWRGAPLVGVPVAIKDNLCTIGTRTTCSSRILETFKPPYDATVIARLKAAGAVIVGKTNCDEFAMGSSTEHSAFGPTHNPWALDRTPGGSSGGSAAAVASGVAATALGSDTGGSIRQPAAMCGIVGIKPTYGRVSRYGLIAFGSSLDQVGPFARTVHDAALVLSVIAGADPADATSAPDQVADYPAAALRDARGLRVGVPRALIATGVDPEVSAAFTAALDVLHSTGVTLVDVELPHASYATPVYYLVATAEASSNLARFDGVRFGYRAPADRSAESAHHTGTSAHDALRTMYARTREQGFGAEVKRRIMLGTYVLSAGYYDAYYLKAQQVRTLILRDYDEAFARVDAIAMPTYPTPAFKLGERMADPLQMYLADIFTVGANLTGLPAISVPCGLTHNRLPIGLQLTGRRFDEPTLFQLAGTYERATEWWKLQPPLASR